MLEFQTEKGLNIDGTVGNQTWAALREGAPEKSGTDGRKPHSFHEEGVEARWNLERETALYLKAADELQLLVVSVGNKPIDKNIATFRVTPPGAKARVVNVPIGPPNQKTATGAGDIHLVKLPKFRETFKSIPPTAEVKDYKVEAYLEKELGGDFWTGPIQEV